MVCSQVVNLPPEHLCPKVFADELHYVQLIFEAGRVSCHPREQTLSQTVTLKEGSSLRMKTVPLNESLSHPEAQTLKDRNTDSSILETRHLSNTQCRHPAWQRSQ